MASAFFRPRYSGQPERTRWPGEVSKVLFIERDGGVLMINSSLAALRQAQEEFAGEAERAGLSDEADVAAMLSQFRRERYDANHG